MHQPDFDVFPTKESAVKKLYWYSARHARTYVRSHWRRSRKK